MPLNSILRRFNALFYLLIALSRYGCGYAVDYFVDKMWIVFDLFDYLVDNNFLWISCG